MYLPKRPHRYIFTNSQRSKILQSYIHLAHFPDLAKRIILDLCDWIRQLEDEVPPERLLELKNWANTDGYQTNTRRSVSTGG